MRREEVPWRADEAGLVMFVLLAEHVPPEIITIASRCVTIEFGPISRPLL